jgi:hypothetical protein
MLYWHDTNSSTRPYAIIGWAPEDGDICRWAFGEDDLEDLDLTDEQHEDLQALLDALQDTGSIPAEWRHEVLAANGYVAHEAPEEYSADTRIRYTTPTTRQIVECTLGEWFADCGYAGQNRLDSCAEACGLAVIGYPDAYAVLNVIEDIDGNALAALVDDIHAETI